MMAFALAGYIVIAVIVIAGIYYLINNITFKKQPERYTYVKYKDEDGNVYEKVKDNEDEQ